MLFTKSVIHRNSFVTPVCRRIPSVIASTIAVNSNWQYFKLKGPYIKNDNYLQVKTLKLVTFPVPLLLEAKIESKLAKDVAGYDFTDEEVEKLKLWPRGLVPYFIDSFSFDKVFRDKLRLFLEKLSELTSLQFLELRSPPSDDESRFVLFVNRGKNDDALDYSPSYLSTKGPQRVRLRYDCFTNGDIHAAVLAVVGVPPQHCAPNRDKYIQVIEENILEEKLPAFKKINDEEWVFHDIDYDFESAGHFDSHKYTKNGQATIMPLIKDASLIPHVKKEFSIRDILKMRYLYNYIADADAPAPLSESACKKLYKLAPGINNYDPTRQKLRGKARPKPSRFFGGVSVSSESQKQTNNKYEENANDKASDSVPEENDGNDNTEENTKDDDIDKDTKN